MVKDTFVLIDAVKKFYPVANFFKDRYFPDYKNYFSEKALIETRKGGRRIAPFVIPVVGGIAMESEGYRAEEVTAPFIAPKMRITAEDISRKAFGENPDSNRSPADREKEIEAEDLDELRQTIFRRHEKMATELITTGRVEMVHYATAKDAANDTNGQMKYLQFYEHEFKNRYLFKTVTGNAGTTFRELNDASAWAGELYDMASVLRARGVKVSDLVMTGDVSKLFFTNTDFLKFYDFRRAELGELKPVETPDGVVYNGTLNIGGIMFNVFTYDDQFTDLDGQTKPFLPAGTIAMLSPKMGKTVYAQVSFIEGSEWKSYAEKVVPRIVDDELDSIREVQSFSRPVLYPNDVDGWLVANVDETLVNDETSENSVDTHEDKTAGVDLQTEEQIRAMKTKAEVIAYAEYIGLSGLTDDQTLSELKNAVISYQNDIYGD